MPEASPPAAADAMILLGSKHTDVPHFAGALCVRQRAGLGLQVEPPVPETVLSAYRLLLAKGFDRQLLRGSG